MLEGFVHLWRPLLRKDVKKLVSMGCQYRRYSKSVTFFINEENVDGDIKEHLLKKFAFIREYVDKIIVFLNEKTNSSKTLIFNYKND